jgi:hypothetical protein
MSDKEETSPKAEKEKEESSEDEWVGPKVSEATEPQPKKRKILHHEKLFLEK